MQTNRPSLSQDSCVSDVRSRFKETRIPPAPKRCPAKEDVTLVRRAPGGGGYFSIPWCLLGIINFVNSGIYMTIYDDNSPKEFLAPAITRSIL